MTDDIDRSRQHPRQAVARKVRSIESAAIAGIVYAVVASTAIVVLTRYPDLALSDADLAAWFTDDMHQAWLVTGLNLAAFSAIAFLWFVAVVRRRIGDREDRFFSTVFLGSAIVYVVIWLIAAAVLAAPAVTSTLRAGGSMSRDTSTLAVGVATALIFVVAPRIQAVFIFSTSTLILRTRALPKWVAYWGYLSGVVLSVVPLVMEPIGFGLPIWVLVVSVTLLTSRPGRQPDAATS